MTLLLGDQWQEYLGVRSKRISLKKQLKYTHTYTHTRVCVCVCVCIYLERQQKRYIDGMFVSPQNSYVKT